MHDDSILSLRSIGFSYPGKPALFENLDFSLSRGEQIGLHGPNGSGKTSIFRLLVGLERPASGQLLFHGAPVKDEYDLRRLRCNIGLVMQNADDQLFSPTVLEDVAFGPLNLGLSRNQARQRALEVLDSLGLTGFADRLTHRLSGGEKKLVSIATVLSMRPEALLLDEPTAFLDDESRERMIGILQKQSFARVIISHDRDFLERTASRFIALGKGGLGEPTSMLPPAVCCCR